jgi:hypothetical protein
MDAVRAALPRGSSPGVAAVMDSDSQEQDGRFQQTLIDFLNTQLDVGFMLCRDAQLEMNMKDERDHALCLENAQIALQTVRRFEGKVADAELSLEIHARADRLEKLIATL